MLAEGSISAAGSPSSIVSMLSGEEEMFAFARAVSRFSLPNIPFVQKCGLYGVFGNYVKRCRRRG